MDSVLFLGYDKRSTIFEIFSFIFNLSNKFGVKMRDGINEHAMGETLKLCSFLKRLASDKKPSKSHDHARIECFSHLLNAVEIVKSIKYDNNVLIKISDARKHCLAKQSFLVC